MEIAKELLEARIAELTQLKDNALAQANAAQGALVELQQWVKHVSTPATETPVRAPVRRGRPKKDGASAAGNGLADPSVSAAEQLAQQRAIVQQT
jgi:hypothetical protein